MGTIQTFLNAIISHTIIYQHKNNQNPQNCLYTQYNPNVPKTGIYAGTSPSRIIVYILTSDLAHAILALLVAPGLRLH